MSSGDWPQSRRPRRMLALEREFGLKTSMVELPGSLERATLGDVLGALHRDKISGALCLEEFGREGHRHIIHWIEGLIHQVETTRPVSLRSAGAGAAERHVAAARSM